MKWYIFMLYLLPILLSSCGSAHNQEDVGIISDSFDIKGDDDMDYIEMTDKEKEILIAIYADSDRIQQGKLFSHQETALQQLRAGMEYLTEKYPGYFLEVLTFEPADKFTPRARLLVQDTESKNYQVTVEPSDGNYICTDNFYGVLIRDNYDKMISDILENSGLTVFSYTEFTAYLGMSQSTDITVDKIISENPKLSRLTHLYIQTSENNDLTVNKIQECLSDEGIYGAYFLYFVPSLKTEDVLALESDPERNSWDYVSFNCFNVE